MTTYYVSTSGSDNANGSADTPWKTINHAMTSNLQPGDTVMVAPGTYTEAVMIDHGGSASAYVHLVSEVPGEALIRPPSGTYSTVSIRANYVDVNGFDVVGGGGHAIDGEQVHHVIVQNNTAHDSGGSGISFYLSEFQTIVNNTVYGNSSSNGYQTSGISVASNINVSGDTTTTGFRTIIENNVSHDNMETTVSGDHTDGNGIIVDFLNNDGTGHPAYTYPTLVENNLVYQNGGKGIQVFNSDNVTVRNNTAYHDNLDLQNPGTERGEITITQSSANSVVANNVAVADPSVNKSNMAFDLSNDSAVAHNNLSFNGTPGDASVGLWNGAQFTAANGNLLGVSPNFVNAGSDNFQLSSGSAAINAGSPAYAADGPDLAGLQRIVGGVVDIGAYEHGATAAGGGASGGTGGTGGTGSIGGSGSTGGTGSVGGTGSTGGIGSTGSGGTSGGVTPENAAPVAHDDSGFSTHADTPLSISASALLANDTDPDGDLLVISGVKSGTGGTATLGTDGHVTFAPTSGFDGTAGFDYTVSDGNGGTDQAHVAVDVQPQDTAPAPSATVGLFGTADTPAVATDPDTSSVELGTKFTVTEDGQIDALRFYKGAENTGTHTATLWSEDGHKLATVTFTDETASGWQEAKLSAPVAVQAGQSYIASYHAPNGHYSVTEHGLDSGMDAGPIQAVHDGGVYSYGASSDMPTQTYEGSNYFVDVAFQKTATTAPDQSDRQAQATNPTGEADATTTNQTSPHQWHHFDFAGANANPASDQGQDAATLRVASHGRSAAHVFLQEADSAAPDGAHAHDVASYMPTDPALLHESHDLMW